MALHRQGRRHGVESLYGYDSCLGGDTCVRGVVSSVVPITLLLVEKPVAERLGSITVKKIVPVGEGQHRVTILKIYAGTQEFGQELTGITAPLDPPGHPRRPHPRQLSSRLRFWPVAVINASILTFSDRLKRNRAMPCHCLPSPKSGSTHTWRLRSAFLYGAVS